MDTSCNVFQQETSEQSGNETAFESEAGRLRFLSYNVGGLLSKLDNHDFTNYITSFDFVCLTETYVSSKLETDVFCDFCAYTANARKLSYHGRQSGGVILFVRNTISSFVERISVEVENCVVVEIKKELFDTDKNIMLIASYIPPCDSNFWKTTQNGFGLELIEKCVLDLYDKRDDFYLILCGDLNARTGSKNCKKVNDNFDDTLTEEGEIFPRRSQDKDTNTFGEQLLELCSMYECVILNGLVDYSFDDSCTFISKAGTSVIDYFIMSSDMLLLANVDSLQVQSQIDSDHMPVVMSISVAQKDGVENVTKQNEDYTSKKQAAERFVWKKEKEDEFLRCFKSKPIQSKLASAKAKIKDNIDDALDDFVSCLISASDCMKKKASVRKGRNRSRAAWFDEECQNARKQTRNKLKKYRQSRDEEDRLQYQTSNKRYRDMIRNKKKEFKRDKAASLASNIKNASMFWKELKSLGGEKKTRTSDKIDMKQWYDHFKGLFGHTEENPENENATFSDENSSLDEDNHPLNSKILEDEVDKSIRNLKTGKACGLDDVLAEMLKVGGHEVVVFLTDLFNAIFDKGYYPKEWAKAIITPIYKKGDVDSADNYRGVSLLSIVSKCYTSILNQRLYNWLEENDKIAEGQAGFRKQYSTIDHVFTLYAIAQKRLSRKGHKLYVAFVDFKKAFDSVHHGKLFETIKNEGIRGRFYGALRAMYDSLLSCVRVNSECSEFFGCPNGVRQGCVLSPTLFSLFINQLATHITEAGRHGVQLLSGMMELFILLFADDITLLATTPLGLQNQLNCLKECCTSLHMEVNREKTKIMVFRKGGYLGEHEKWYYDGCLLEVVNEYCYLGFRFTTMLSLKLGTKHLVEKGRKAAFYLCRTYHRLKEMTKSTFFKIFDSKVQSVLLYSAEIWGLCRLDNIERVQLMVCKRFLGVPTKTPNKMIYGELGRYPLFVNSYVRCLKYWFRLLEMDQNRHPKQAYMMLFKLDENGKRCWVTEVREVLSRCGFYFVWLQQGVGNVSSFIQAFKLRLIDIFKQEWFGTIQEKDRYEIYRSCKSVFGEEKYLSALDIYCFRAALAQFRLGVLPINNNIHRYNENPISRNCVFCENTVEDEHHFLFLCPLYSDLRTRFLNCSLATSVGDVLRWKGTTKCRSLSKLIFYAVKRRKLHAETVST